MTTSKLFICYRREDAAYPAQWIKDKVAAHFGADRVVFDVDTIPIGANFRVCLYNEVSKCDVLLAVIGDRWRDILRQRLDDPEDFVRIEIQAALKREIPVVPILVGHASQPSEKDLPPELAELSYRQAAEVRAGKDLETHLDRLIRGLAHVLGEKEEEKEDPLNKRILLKGGGFLMGSPEGEGDDIERPQHWVRLSPFYIQEHEVTNAEYRRFDPFATILLPLSEKPGSSRRSTILGSPFLSHFP